MALGCFAGNTFCAMEDWLKGIAPGSVGRGRNGRALNGKGMKSLKNISKRERQKKIEQKINAAPSIIHLKTEISRNMGKKLDKTDKNFYPLIIVGF